MRAAQNEVILESLTWYTTPHAARVAIVAIPAREDAEAVPHALRVVDENNRLAGDRSKLDRFNAWRDTERSMMGVDGVERLERLERLER